MLDEVLEFKQYKQKYTKIHTTMYCNSKIICSKCTEPICPFRLSYSQLKQELAGIRRPLEIVAREAMFKNNIPNIKSAKSATIRWLNNYLTNDYIEQIYPHNLPDEREKDPADLQLLKNELSAFRKRYNKPLFKEENYEDNDITTITIDKIIATAIEKGPLKKYLLIAKKDPWLDELSVKKQKKGKSKNTKLTEGEKDYLLKLTAAFLIDNTKNQKCIKLTEADILNWCIDHTKKNALFYFGKDKEPVFTKVHVTQGTTPVKFKFSNDWISIFEIRDVTTEKQLHDSLEYIKINNGYYYYIDQGSNRVLKECKPHN